MILQKSIKESVGPSSSATILGLKVVGGKQITSGYFGALIEKVKKGSVADTVGHLLPGKYLVKVDLHQNIFHSKSGILIYT